MNVFAQTEEVILVTGNSFVFTDKMSSLKSLEPTDLALYDQDDDDAQDLKEALDALEPAIEISKPSGKSGDVKEAKDADKARKDSKRAGAAVAPAKRGRVSFAPEREDKDSKEAKEKRAAEAKADAQQEDEGKKRDVNVLAFTSMRDVLDRVMLPSIKLRRRLVDYIVQTAKAGVCMQRVRLFTCRYVCLFCAQALRARARRKSFTAKRCSLCSRQ